MHHKKGARPRSLFFLLTMMIGLMMYLSIAHANAASLVARPLFPNFYLQEPVNFSLQNTGTEAVMLSSAAPWRIVDANGRTIYSPLAAAMLVGLKPGQSMSWVWDQRTDRGVPVDSGTYTVIFDGSRVTTALVINRVPGSRGFFTFTFPDRQATTLRVWMSNPYAIRDAIDNYYGKNNKKIPIGPLLDDRPRRSPYDSQWSWHFDPARIAMTENAIEHCDATPQYVEENLDYWLTQVVSYCPWSAQIRKLE